MSYAVKEIYFTLQGEGANTGRPAVFCRFAGCNLWSGREEDRGSATCRFCDTDFVGTDGPGGGAFRTAAALAAAVAARWPEDEAAGVPHAVQGPRGGPAAPACAKPARPPKASGRRRRLRSGEGRPRLVVCTGGEPLLQLDAALVRALHAAGFAVAVETNGTLRPPAGLDWICVSPKAGAGLACRRGDELKLVYPQAGAAPEAFEGLAFRHFFLQPMDGPEVARNTELAARYCEAHPRWRLSLQTHKLVGLP